MVDRQLGTDGVVVFGSRWKLKKSETTKKKTDFSTVFKCSICLEVYGERKDLNKHLSSVHTLKCQLCPARYLTKKDMDQHITVHEQIKCPFCPEKFAKGADMNKHVSSVHTIKCQLCL